MKVTVRRDCGHTEEWYKEVADIFDQYAVGLAACDNCMHSRDIHNMSILNLNSSNVEIMINDNVDSLFIIKKIVKKLSDGTIVTRFTFLDEDDFFAHLQYFNPSYFFNGLSFLGREIVKNDDKITVKYYNKEVY